MAGSVVLVHGFHHGAWCWDKVIDGLRERGIKAIAVDLPGRGTNKDRPVGLAESVAVIDEAIAAAGGPVVLLGHSAGGGPVTHAAMQNPQVGHLVYLAAIVPTEDGLMDKLTAETMERLDPVIRFADGKSLVMSIEDAKEIMYNDCTDEDIRRAYDQLVPEVMAGRGPPADSGAAPWQKVATTYIVCREDRSILPEHQRQLAARMRNVIEFPTSHSPFLSRPELVVDTLAKMAAEL